LLNLRGRIITAIDMRRRLGLSARADERPAMAASVEAHGECYGLMVDAVGEVLNLDDAGCEPAPPNLDPAMARAATGVHRLDGQLMVVLDIDRVLDIRPTEWRTPT
jgi:purine-binding chemotaxis protein CheW